MPGKSKLELLLKLNNKIFNSKLAKTQKKLDKGTKGMKGKLKKLKDFTQRTFAGAGARLKSYFKNAFDEIPGLGRAMKLIRNPIVAATAGMAAFGVMTKKAVRKASEFNNAFLQIKQVNLGKPAKEMAKYRKQIRNAAFDIGTDLTKTTNAFFDLQSVTGLFGEDAVKVFKTVGKFSLATGADLNETMKSASKAMKSFGLEADEITVLLESNAKAVNAGLVTFDQLAKVQTTYAAAAATAGQAVDSANKVFAFFLGVSKNADEASTKSKTFFQGLQQQSAKIKQFTGVNIFDNGKMRQADDILKDISKHFKGMSDQQISQIIAQIGGPEGLQDALNNAGTAAEGMLKTFNSFDSSSFSLSDALKNAAGDFQTQKKIFGNRLNTLMTKWGEKLLPMIAGIFDKLTPIINWLYEHMDTLIPIVGTLAGTFALVTAATWAWNTALAANPVGLIIIAVAGLIALVTMMIKKWDQWGAAMSILLGPLGILISLVKSLHDHWQSIKDAFTDGGILKGLKRIGQVLLDTLLKPIQQLYSWIGKITGWDWVKNMAGTVENLRKKMDLETEGEKKMKEKTLPKPKLPKGIRYEEDEDPINEDMDLSDSDKLNTGQDISRTVGKGNQVKNMTINVESIVSGGITVAKEDFQGMTKEEMEDYMAELFQRMVADL